LITERTRGTIAAALAAVVFGSSFVATAFQLDGFTPLGGALWRSAFAAVILLGLSFRMNIRSRTLPHPRSRSTVPLAGRLVCLLVLGVLGGLVFVIGMNVAVSRLGATITAFVAGLYAILATLFAPIVLGERLARRAIAGFAVALAGTALLAELAPSADSVGGLAAGGIAALAYGLYLVLVRRWSSALQIGPVDVSLSIAGTSTMGLAIILVASDPQAALPTSVTPSVVIATIWLIVVSAVGPLLIATALRRIEASLASSLLLLNPITATVLAVILLHERPSPLQLLGGLLVLIGMAAATDLVGATRRRRAASRLEPERIS
jgi:DME family drug/metabolite transporter